MLKHSLSCR